MKKLFNPIKNYFNLSFAVHLAIAIVPFFLIFYSFKLQTDDSTTITILTYLIRVLLIISLSSVVICIVKMMKMRNFILIGTVGSLFCLLALYYGEGAQLGTLLIFFLILFFSGLVYRIVKWIKNKQKKN
jgi:hypothetical protein